MSASFDALGLEPGEQDVRSVCGLIEAVMPAGMCVPGGHLADTAVAVGLLQLDWNRNTDPAAV